MSIPAAKLSPHAAFAADARRGLDVAGQKTLPSSYLYDAVGSALFEVITALPEYGVTRAEERLLQRHAQAIANAVRTLPTVSSPSADMPQTSSKPVSVARDALPLRVIELGSGSGRKTRLILQALTKSGPVIYCPIDISKSALDHCCRTLSDIPGVQIEPFESDYLPGVAKARQARRPGERTLVLFLGSTIGNFAQLAATHFLSALRGTLQPGDAMLLGADLLKPVDTLLRAYDDEIGVTAAFNLNMLARMNRELDANFDIDGFAHVARFNPNARSVEMHLRSERTQRVSVPGADMQLSFQVGETIWTESSHKYTADEVVRMGEAARFDLIEQWVDDQWPFAETLLAVH